MEKEVDVSNLPSCCQLAKDWASAVSFKSLAKKYDMQPQEVLRELRKHVAHSRFTRATS